MQRLTAYRILTERRIGNWSGVGAGKTISAIFASRVINAKFTIIIAFNSTIEGWATAIAFPSNQTVIALFITRKTRSPILSIPNS
jgi:hypothetical protein